MKGDSSMTRRPIPFLAIGAVAAIALAGCGSSGSASTGAAAGSGSGPYSSGGSTTAATPVAAKQTATGPATIATKKTDLGTILVGGGGRTLYLWVADKGTMSTCNGACAQAWPPVLTKGKPKASGGVKAALLGTTTRADGKTEVTYEGHPLYTFVGDKASGDTTGQGSDGFGALWWVVGTNGNAITTG
jgi:predicted lipoprotein with Yx(FWY)xxD motif